MKNLERLITGLRLHNIKSPIAYSLGGAFLPITQKDI
jgi:hypothetical protein